MQCALLEWSENIRNYPTVFFVLAVFASTLYSVHLWTKWNASIIVKIIAFRQFYQYMIVLRDSVLKLFVINFYMLHLFLNS